MPVNFSSVKQTANLRRVALSMAVTLAFSAGPVNAAKSRGLNQTATASSSQAPTQAGDAQAAIRAVLEQQTAAWNRGDVDGFMQGYKDSPDTTFISKHVKHGYQAVRARYKRTFTSRTAMGTLSFHHLDIHPLCADYATVTGEFHLKRTRAGGGNASGVFSLLFQKTPEGWRILLDHTTSSS